MSALPAPLTCLVQQNASLRRYNTFGIDVRARWLVRLRVTSALPELVARQEWAGMPVLLLGDGSNILFRDDFDGVLIKLDCQRVEQLAGAQGINRVRAEAGRHWHGFVHWLLERDLNGLENLSLIPGTVGASPVQNIGAYGVELDPMVEAVEAYDRETCDFVELDRSACGFSYRTSLFKQEAMRARYVITAVRFALPQNPPLVLHYPGVREELAAMGHDEPTARNVSDAVSAIRRRKLPDPAKCGNAGSFFKNPIVTSELADALKRENPGLPMYPAGAGKAKLAAAWMIEECGLKGVRDGDAGVSEMHALVLVNHGHATGAQVWSLAERVRDTVHKRFEVMLEPEPLIV